MSKLNMRHGRKKPDGSGILRCKRAINAMVADIASPRLADSVAMECSKVQKALIRNRIDGGEAGNGIGLVHQCLTERDTNPGWRPGWMQVPPTRLVDGAGCATVEAWERIAGLFPGEDEDNAEPATEPCEADAA